MAERISKFPDCIKSFIGALMLLVVGGAGTLVYTGVAGGYKATTVLSYGKEDLFEVKEGVNILTIDVAEIKFDIAEIKFDIAEIKVELAEIKGDVAEIKGDVAEIKEDVAEIKVELAEIKGDIKELLERTKITQ